MQKATTTVGIPRRNFASPGGGALACRAVTGHARDLPGDLDLMASRGWRAATSAGRRDRRPSSGSLRAACDQHRARQLLRVKRPRSGDDCPVRCIARDWHTMTASRSQYRAPREAWTFFRDSSGGFVNRLGRELDLAWRHRALQLGNGRLGTNGNGTIRRAPPACFRSAERDHTDAARGVLSGPHVLNTYGGAQPAVDTPHGGRVTATNGRSRASCVDGATAGRDRRLQRGERRHVSPDVGTACATGRTSCFRDAMRTGNAGSIVMFDSNLWHAAA